MKDARGIQWSLTHRLEDLDFADDVGLLSHSYQDMQAKTNALYITAKSVGLEINNTKTKNMRTNSTQTAPITINEHQIEQVDQYTYLGSIISRTGGTDEDIQARIAKARHAFATLRPVWNNKNIHLHTKVRIFNTNVKSVLLYGSESWKYTKTMALKLQVFINTCLRWILHIKWPDHISNQELWQKTNQEPIAITIKRQKWKWVGHTLRKNQNSIPRSALDWNPQGKRKRGRPTSTWRRTLNTELKTIHMSWGEAKKLAHDRDRWRNAVEALCSHRN